MHARWPGLICFAVMTSGAVSAEETSVLDALHLEAHGFVSFGYLKSWGNNWLGETLDGTDEFWEAGANVIARPLDHLRIGAQLFVRDLGIYGNGEVDLDWAYADWRVDDALGIQVGRVKLPLGLYGDSLDIDAARPTAFLPRIFVYPLRGREIQTSTDGAKLYGTVGPVDWAVFAGNREFADDGDFANQVIFVSKRLSEVTDIETDYLAGLMVHWRTPVTGLQARLSAATVHDLVVEGRSLSGTAAVRTELPDWYIGTIGLLYEVGDFTWGAEYLRFRSSRDVTITPLAGPVIEIHEELREENAYVSLTWHARPWLDCYAALEGMWDDPNDRHGAPYSQNVVAAFAVMPTDHWLFKVEYRYLHGTKDIDENLNPEGVADDTHVLAVKTTVDF